MADSSAGASTIFTQEPQVCLEPSAVMSRDRWLEGGQGGPSENTVRVPFRSHSWACARGRIDKREAECVWRKNRFPLPVLPFVLSRNINSLWLLMSKYDWFSLLAVVLWNRCKYWQVAPPGNTESGSLQASGHNILLTNPYMTLFCVCGCVKTPYSIWCFWSLTLNSEQSALSLMAEQADLTNTCVFSVKHVQPSCT